MRRIGTWLTRRKPTFLALPWIVVFGVVVWFRLGVTGDEKAPSPMAEANAATMADSGNPEASNVISFPRESWESAGLKTDAVKAAPFAQSVELTGKIALNEDRIAHIFPLVEGRVDEVRIKLGDKVRKGDLLVVVQSRDVGLLMLQLFEDRLQRDFARTKDRWTQTVAENTQAMIKLMRNNATIDEIEKQLTDRPMGEYRDRLMTAYVAHFRADRSLARLKQLSEGAVAGKQVLDAEAEWKATRATLQSLLEQLQQETQQASTVSQQTVKELETRVAVDETNLKIIGFDDESLSSIDPVQQGEAISHYPIHSPFDGTIISKDVVLLERVGPESQILSIADLSTVWVTTDIYEEHLPLLKQLDGRTIRVHSPAWPGKIFEAEIFYTGDLVHESSRTIAMRAIADNSDGELKPGMFVSVELPEFSNADVTQVPSTAVQEHAGETFVFVHRESDLFERRNVTVGRRNAERVEIRSGLQPGEIAVVEGGFALKSQMLAELLSE